VTWKPNILHTVSFGKHFSFLFPTVLELFAKNWKLGLICQKNRWIKTKKRSSSCYIVLSNFFPVRYCVYVCVCVCASNLLIRTSIKPALILFKRDCVCVSINRHITLNQSAASLALIKTMTFILAFYSSDDSWRVLDENIWIFNSLFQGYLN